jgi:hypothetical protein
LTLHSPPASPQDSRDLQDAVAAFETSSTRASKVLIVLTIVLILLTAAIVVLTVVVAVE